MSPQLHMCPMNVEIAHVRSWFSRAALDSAQESMLIATELCEARGISFDEVTLSLLVDDKADAIGDRAAWLAEACDSVPSVFRRIDYICFESDLIAIAEVFLASLRNQNRGRRAREIERYRNKHGRIACSHDIAVWHSFRLGRLGRHDHLLSRSPCRVPSEHTHPFYTVHAVSILEEEDRDDEDRAKELMAEAADNGASMGLETIFYAP